MTPHGCALLRPWAIAAGVGAAPALLHTTCLQATPDHRCPPGKCDHHDSELCKDVKFCSLGAFFAQSRHQMLIFSHEISLSDWFYHLFPSPWASIGWTSFILKFSAWDLLFCAAGSQPCKSLPTPSLPPDVVIGSFVFFHYFFQHRKLAL